MADTGGLTVTVTDANRTWIVTEFSGRLLGRASNTVGTQPIVTTSVPALIGKEVREVKYTLQARSFLPLTVTAIEWTGQHFNNVRRV